MNYADWLEKNVCILLNEDELFELWDLANEDEPVYHNDKYFFNSRFDCNYELACAISAGNYTHTHNYVFFNNKGNLESCNNIDDENSLFNLHEVIDYIINNQEEIENDSRWSAIRQSAYENDLSMINQ